MIEDVLDGSAAGLKLAKKSDSQFCEKTSKISDGSITKTEDFGVYRSAKAVRNRTERFEGCSNKVWGLFEPSQLQPSSQESEFHRKMKDFQWYFLRGHIRVNARWRHRIQIVPKTLKILQMLTHPLHFLVKKWFFLSLSCFYPSQLSPRNRLGWRDVAGDQFVIYLKIITH